MKQTFQVTPVQLPATTYSPGFARTSVRRALLSQAEATVALRQKELASANKAVRSPPRGQKRHRPPPPRRLPALRSSPMIFPAPSASLENDHGQVDLEEVSVGPVSICRHPADVPTPKPHPADFSVTLKLKILGGKDLSLGRHRFRRGRFGQPSGGVPQRVPQGGEDPVHALWSTARPPTPQTGSVGWNSRGTGTTSCDSTSVDSGSMPGSTASDNSCFPLPSRRTGTLSIWTYDSAAEFDSIRAGGLNPKFVLAQTPTAPKTAVVDLQQDGSTRTHRRNAKGRTSRPGQPSGTYRRRRGSPVRVSLRPNPGTVTESRPVFIASRCSGRPKPTAGANVAEQRRPRKPRTTRHSPRPGRNASSWTNNCSRPNRPSPRKKMDPSFPAIDEDLPVNPGTGRRLALARWITDRRNPWPLGSV
ncbi:MAG: hypothetical protein Ct9H300mP1_04090 [Planctomycetaceae bacterium]|nr:MAG: hypothetical protein Ct9H300mP1_04090 [Planctomycetaceae bacterium]